MFESRRGRQHLEKLNKMVLVAWVGAGPDWVSRASANRLFGCFFFGVRLQADDGRLIPESDNHFVQLLHLFFKVLLVDCGHRSHWKSA